jgi:hypothetical protein
MTVQEHRRFTRIPFQASVVLSLGQRRWESQLIDISLKGALVTRPADWNAKPGDRVNMEVRMEVAEVMIDMSTQVAHIEADHVGLRCEHIDVESISHLRRLVELNLGDEKQLQRELDALGRID